MKKKAEFDWIRRHDGTSEFEEFIDSTERKIEMSRIKKLIEEKTAASAEFAQVYDTENKRLKVAVALMRLRESEGLTQRQLAEKVGKPQSTIARIENGNMNVSYGTLSEIANGLGKTLEIRFV